MSPAFVRIGLAGAVLALAAGCTRIKDHKGFVADMALVDTVQPGVDNRDSVAKTLGRPSFDGQFDGDRTWYYLSRDTRQLAFANPKPVKQLLLTVTFDKAGNVESVKRSGLETAMKVDRAPGKTPTRGTERSFFQELFGNIGAVGASGQGSSTADNPN